MSYPKHSRQYGEYRWHHAWKIDVVKREARHKSGLVFDFFCGIVGSKEPPLGGRCASLHWRGELRGGEQALPAGLPRHVAVRICLEACTLFSGEARDVCQDCSKHTFGSDYYMIQHALWLQAHPNNHGMLCLSCLQTRLGRRLEKADFLHAPINQGKREIEAILDGSPCSMVVL